MMRLFFLTKKVNNNKVAYYRSVAGRRYANLVVIVGWVCMIAVGTYVRNVNLVNASETFELALYSTFCIGVALGILYPLLFLTLYLFMKAKASTTGKKFMWNSAHDGDYFGWE